VGEPNGGGDFIDVLSPGTAGPEDILADFVGLDIDIKLFGFGQNGDGGGGGVDSTLGLGNRDALDAVTAALVGQSPISAGTSEGKDDFAESAQIGGREMDELGFPGLALGISSVHLVEVSSEESGFLTTGAGPNFHNAGIDVQLLVG
jgi:hypothetical protein